MKPITTVKLPLLSKAYDKGNNKKKHKTTIDFCIFCY